MAASPPPDASPANTAPPPEKPYPNPVYAWYVVLLLMVAYVFSFIDRQILALLVGPIKADLGISDTEMSYLMGFSFALFYTFFGIPLGRLADSRSRRTIIAVGLIFWSIMSAGCGLAQRYWQLLIMRMGVGVGEASLSPAAYSLITDYFPPHRRALAISMYGMGIYIGSGLAYLFGGLVVGYASTHQGFALPIVGAVKSWQLVFFAVGLPGLLFAVFLYTIREPFRRASAVSGAAHAPVPFSHAIQYIRANWGCFFCHNTGFAMFAFMSYAATSWIPSYFVRVFAWTTAEAGVRFGLSVLVCGSAGIMFGGFLADQLAHRGSRDSHMRVGFYAALVSLPCGIAFPLLNNDWAALAVLSMNTFILAIPFGIAPAAIQEMMPSSMRGQASAIYLFVVNLIGMGLGPSAVAWFTDYVFHDESKVGQSLLAVNIIGCISAALLLGFGMRHYRYSLEYLANWHAQKSQTSNHG